jgi:hypothetical protein
MTDDMHTENHETANPGSGDETFAWSAEPESSTTNSGQAREWLAQLQGMIENLATQAGPVIREVGIKAAELAAVAGDKAGPVAQKAAELTGQAGQKLAERSRVMAADLRRDKDAAQNGQPGEIESESIVDKSTADVV